MRGRWFCRVCGADSPDAIGKRSLPVRHNVIALPCGHEQPADQYGGLGFEVIDGEEVEAASNEEETG